jgi:hypothetical protein
MKRDNQEDLEGKENLHEKRGNDGGLEEKKDVGKL